MVIFRSVWVGLLCMAFVVPGFGVTSNASSILGSSSIINNGQGQVSALVPAMSSGSTNVGIHVQSFDEYAEGRLGFNPNNNTMAIRTNLSTSATQTKTNNSDQNAKNQTNEKKETNTTTDTKKAESGEDNGSENDADDEKKFGAKDLLRGASMASIGIGGMELARGAAEQNVDKDFEAKIADIVENFECKVGDKRYDGMTKNNTIVGQNQLMALPGEYKELAKSLKERKQELGIKPGIESEIIIEASDTGLYDNAGSGEAQGRYTSIARAQMGIETDKNRLQEDKDASTRRLVGGVAAMAVGVVGDTLLNTTGDEKLSEVLNGSNDTGESFDFTENGTEYYGFNEDGNCAKSVTDKINTATRVRNVPGTWVCSGLTKMGTWYTKFSFGTVYGEAKCGKNKSGALLCKCKVTAVDNKKMKKLDWVQVPDTVLSDAWCDNSCATLCSRNMSDNQDFREKLFRIDE